MSGGKSVSWGVRWLSVIFLSLLLSSPAVGQTIRIEVEEAPLRDALLNVRDQAGVDIVFSEALVLDRRTTCTYEGTSVEEALVCVLRPATLEAQRVRRRQYVVVRASSADAGKGTARRWTLRGFVIDRETGEALPGAHIYLSELRVGAVTNNAGYFALSSLPPGDYAVQVSFLGYTTGERRIAETSAPVIVPLVFVALEGGGVVVEDERASYVVGAASPGLLRESVRRLERLPSFPGESDLFQALQRYPGIRKAGELHGGMLIRGASPDQNLYMLDGAPVYHPWHAFSLISIFQTETFKDIKLYRGSFPVEYGGRISSVLDAQMKDGSQQEPRALMALSPLSGRMVVESPVTANSSFMAAARRSYLDKIIGREHPVENADGRRDTLRTGYHFYDASAKYTHRFKRGNRLSVSYYRGGDELDLRLPFDLSLDFSSWLRPADLFFEVAQEWRNQLVSARYQHLFSERLFATGTVYMSTYRARESTLLRPTISAVMQSDYRVDLRDMGMKMDIEYFRSVSHRIQVGMQAGVRDFSSSLDALIRRSAGTVDRHAQTNKAAEPELAIYAQDVWQLNERWTIHPGVRLNVFGSEFRTDVSPSLALEHVIDPRRLRLRAGVSRTMQYLHRLRDRYAFTYDLVTSRWIPAGEDIPPSSGYQGSMGVESRPLRGLTLHGDVYWRYVTHVLLPEDEFRSKNELVGPGIDVGELLGQYVRGKARAYGVEFSAVADRGPWSVRLNYAGGRSLTRSGALGETSFRPSRYDVPRSFGALVARKIGKWRVTSILEVRSGYPTTVPVAQYAIGDPLDETDRYLYRPFLNNGRLPPYFRMDIAAERSFRVLGASWLARLHLYNVTNRRNVTARQYLPSDQGMEVQNRRGLPILPLFEIRMQL